MTTSTTGMLPISQALSIGWNLFQKNLAVLVKLFGGYLVFVFIWGMVMGAIGRVVGPSIAGLLNTFVNIVMGVVLLIVCLDIVDGKPVSIDSIRARMTGKLLLNYVVVSVLVSIGVVIGLLLFIIPGIIIFYRYLFATTIAIDRGTDVSESFALSQKLTDNVKMSLFGFIVVIALINIGGALLLGIGLVITIPVTQLAYLSIYRHLTQQRLGETKGTVVA